jgi:integrase
VRQVWRWAAENELVPAEKWQALSAVKGLGKGRSAAPEDEDVRPPRLRAVAAVLRAAPAPLAAMIRIQWLTGCRCQDVVRMKAADVDRSREVWVYRPPYHKGTHRGKPRSVWIGPKAQTVLAPWLLKAGVGPVFPGKKGREQSVWTYSQAVRRLCRRLEAEEWTPLQLRHAAGTRFRKLFGVEAARVLLGHSSAVTTEIYAERDDRGAAEAMRRVG